MDRSPKFLSPQTVAKLRGLELRARTIVEGYVAGVHRSPFHGFSIEFAQHREYVQGDDLRRLDWKLFGKTDKFYLKQYEEETNLISYLLLDTSESMSYQSAAAPWSKLACAQTVAASLACLILHQQDSVGLVTFDDEIRSFVRASGNPSQIKPLVQAMERARAVGKTRTGAIFHELAERFKKRGLAIIISDLFDDVPRLLAGLKHFRHRRHEVIVFHVLDPDELEFPFQHATLFKGLEQFPEVLADPPALRRAYLAEFERFRQAVQRGCREQRIDYCLVRTDQPVEWTLSTYLASRREHLPT